MYWWISPINSTNKKTAAWEKSSVNLVTTPENGFVPPAKFWAYKIFLHTISEYIRSYLLKCAFVVVKISWLIDVHAKPHEYPHSSLFNSNTDYRLFTLKHRGLISLSNETMSLGSLEDSSMGRPVIYSSREGRNFLSSAVSAVKKKLFFTLKSWSQSHLSLYQTSADIVPIFRT